MAYTFTLAVAQVDGLDFVKSDETYDGTPNIYIQNVDTSAQITGSHLGDGVYGFTISSTDIHGLYTVWSDSGPTQLTKFGTIPIGEGGTVKTTGNQTIGGVKTFSAQAIFSSGLKSNTIAANSGSTVTVAGIPLTTDLTTSNIVNLNGTQTISAVKTFTALPESTTSCSTAYQFANKTYVDAQVAAVNVIPYQQGSNIRRIISGVTEQAGKVYSTIANAISNISSTSATNRFIIELEKGQADANYSDIFFCLHSTLESLSPCYVTLKGKSRFETNLLLGGTGDTATYTNANLYLENMTVWLSNDDLSGARIYNSVNFSNCRIMAYENLTLPSVRMVNCFVESPSSKTVTISGTGYYLSSQFTASVTENGSGFYTDYVDSLNSTHTMPTEPDLST